MIDFADQPGGDDVVLAAETLATALESTELAEDAMSQPAGGLRWTCGRTLAHIADAVGWYAANLARRTTQSAGYPDAPINGSASELIDILRSAAALLRLAVGAAGLEDRAWHSFGIADRSGFAAMGCDEILVHGWDLAQGLGFEFAPPADVVEKTVRRIFPWAPGRDAADPWDALLWANGRIPLNGLEPETHWLWHCAPLADWDGQIRRWKPRRKTPGG